MTVAEMKAAALKKKKVADKTQHKRGEESEEEGDSQSESGRHPTLAFLSHVERMRSFTGLV